MTEYLPETSICAVQLDSPTNIANDDSSDTSTCDAVPLKLEEGAELGICRFLILNVLFINFIM